MSIQSVLQEITQTILKNKKRDKPFIVGINGVDGSGKSHLAKKLFDHFSEKKYDVIVISIDDFHNPKSYRYKRGEENPEAYYYDSINYEVFSEDCLKPLFEAEIFPFYAQVTHLDLASDSIDVHYETVSEETIVIVEGVFLFRPEIVKYLNLKIFIHADFNITLERMKKRDVKDRSNKKDIDAYEQRTLRKYTPGQLLYFDEINPQALADITVENNDYHTPFILESSKK